MNKKGNVLGFTLSVKVIIHAENKLYFYLITIN